jgi:hypothetical protein
MDCLRAFSFLLLLFFGFLSSPANAQINLKTGYSFSVLSTPALHRVVSSFNQSQSYISHFHDLDWMHGFEAGLRLKGGVHALELTYQGASKSFKATGLIPGSINKYTDNLRYSANSLAVGYQLTNGTLGIGTDLLFQFYKVKYVEGLTKHSFSNMQHMTAFKFYLMVTFKGDTGIDFALQPFVILPSKAYDLQPLADILHTEAGTGEEKWIRYGLTISFYNGKK